MKLMPVHLFTKNQNFHLKTNLISIGLNEWICQTVQWNANALIYYLCFATLFVWVNCWRETMAPWKRQQQQQQRWFLEWITFACLGRRAVGAEGVGGATCHGTIRFWQISETYHNQGGGGAYSAHYITWSPSDFLDLTRLCWASMSRSCGNCALLCSLSESERCSKSSKHLLAENDQYIFFHSQSLTLPSRKNEAEEL